MSAPASGAFRQRCYLEACLLDVMSLKPGNVRFGGPVRGVSALDFVTSARASASALDQAGARVGRRVLSAVCRTRRVVQSNTNLGIVLLAAPLFRAAEAGGDLRGVLAWQLADLDRRDAVLAYRAIRLARPGGMGRSSRHDLQSPPRVTLLQAMREAQQRDSIARQYAHGFRDLFDEGIAHWLDALARFDDELWATTYLYLVYLSRWRDSLLERKFGAATAQAVSEQAARFLSQFSAYSRLNDMASQLLTWDRQLRRDALNPGTSADLTVATVFAAKLCLPV